MKKIYLLVLILFACINPYFAQWGQVNNGITNLTSGAKLLGSSNTYVFAGTLGGNKMYRTSNNGNNWSEITPPVTGNVPECGYYFSGKYFSGLNSSMDCIYYSTNDGTTWTSVSGAPQTTVVRGFISLSSNIFAYTSNKGVYRSTDGGLTWVASNTGLTNLNVIWMETINTKLIAATIGGGVYISSDNGGTWVQSNTGINSGDLNATLSWRMGTSLYYTAQGGGSYSSNNDGTNWTNWTKPAFMGIGVNEVYRNGSNLYLESRRFNASFQQRDSVYITSNEGSTWTNITGNLSGSDLNASGITESGGYAFIAYNLMSPSQGIYRRTTTVGIKENESSNYINVYPNPFNNKITIVTDGSKQMVQIFNVLGSLIQSTIIENEKTEVDLSNQSSGVYFVRIGNYSKKLIKE